MDPAVLAGLLGLQAGGGAAGIFAPWELEAATERRLKALDKWTASLTAADGGAGAGDGQVFGQSNDGPVVKLAGWGKLMPLLPTAVDVVVSGSDLAEEVEKEALARGDSPDLARKKAEDARGAYLVDQLATAGATAAANARGGKTGGAVGTAAGTVELSATRKRIKENILAKTEADYNTMFPGTSPPGPG